MPRCVRVFLAGGVYHVYCRVARGEFIFNEAGEVEHWVELVAFVSRLFDLRVLAWCLLSNHYHMVVQTGSMPLCDAMARLQGRYAKEYNHQRGLKGRVWQSRYKARLVLDDEYLKHVIAYVHLNPAAAGMVDDPLDHVASGHAELLGLRAPVLCDVSRAMLCYDEELKTARRVYQERLRMVAEERWFRAGIRDLPWWRTVDDDDETVEVERAPDGATDFSGQPLAVEMCRRPSLERVFEVFEDELGIPAAQIAGGGRSRILSWYRCLFATFAVSWLAYPTKDVAAALGKASGSVSRWLGEGLELQLSEPSFRMRLERLREAVGSRAAGPGPGPGRRREL